MNDRFASSQRKIARAKEHFLALEQENAAYFGEDPYKQTVEPSPRGPAYSLHKVKLVKALPSCFSEIVGDTVVNLRAALDHALYTVATSRLTSPRNATFPFADSAERLEASLKGRCKDVPQEIWPLLRSFRPYRGGNDLLYALNSIANADKHTMLIPIGTAALNVHTSVRAKGFASTPLPGRSEWDRTRQEMVFLETHKDTEVDCKVGIAFFIAFNHVGTVDGEPIMNTLFDIIGEVEGTVSAIEANSHCLGLV